MAEFLRAKEVAADHFHAGLPPESKKSVQQRFIGGELRVIAATNAFGMGIDKPDVRLVIHADIPGSLENYLQEAGRAGRDRQTARCVLLYATDDVERQFGMSARSRLTRREIHGVLRALRNLDRKKRLGGEVVATAGEILSEDDEKVFERDSATDDTRVRTALAWLEEAVLLTREENRVQVFPSSLRVSSVEEARAKLDTQPLADVYRGKLLALAATLIDADPDDGISTDELMGVSGLSAEGVRGALYDLERLGIASNDTALTAFVHAGVERSSRKRLEEAAALETTLIEHLRQTAPDMGKGDTSALHLRVAAQVLRDEGVANPLPERLWRILRGLAYDGQGEGGGAGSLRVRKRDAETVQVTLQREWTALTKTAALRRAAAKRLLEHLLACLPSGQRGTDLLAETTLGKLLAAIESDIILKSEVRKSGKLLDRALLWLHEQEVIRLHKGLAVFRPAMTIRLTQEKQGRGFANADFKPLRLHYKGQVLQIHVMVEFARRGLDAMAEALQLAMDYFSFPENEFLHRWLPDRDKELDRETTLESWQTIVENLKNPVQKRIVADDREQTNVLVLAGPGSGKTRVLVHRIAYLLRARREQPRGILALAYNRHAAVEIRRRLEDLIGDDARGVTVLTCHGLAMRLAGASFTGRADRPDREDFQEVLRQAVALLRGEGLAPEEADEQRERLLAGFRWILVDEYQDIGPDQYELISALAGRTIEDEDRKLTLFAVGDDDQNIYAFNGASVEFIRRFEADYGPKPTYLTDNYRSSGHIIAAANALIEPARQRMKAGHPIGLDRARAKSPPGGAWAAQDPVARGRVQILPAPTDPISQARDVMTELRRLAGLSPEWNWSTCAVIAREWKYLDPVRAFCAVHGIPAQMGNEVIPSFWRLRETRALVDWVRERETRLVNGAELHGWMDARPAGPWIALLREALDEHALDTGGEAGTPAPQARSLYSLNTTSRVGLVPRWRNRWEDTDRATSLRSDERSTSPESVFQIPGIGVPLQRNTQSSPCSEDPATFRMSGSFSGNPWEYFMMRVSAVVCCVLVLVLPGADLHAQRGGVFLPAETSGDADPAPGVTVLRSRLVRVDLGALAVARADAQPGATPPALTLNLFDDVVFSVVVERTTPTASGYTLQGRLDGVELGTMTLVVNGEVVAGAVRTPQATYRIRSAGDGLHAIRQIDPSTLPPGGEPLIPPPVDVDPPAADPSIVAADDGSVIDVAVFYTPAARRAEGGTAAIEALIDLMIAETNSAYADSRVIQRVRLVARAVVAYTEASTAYDDLDAQSDGIIDEIHEIRDGVGADLVHLIVDRDRGGDFDVCGLAWRMVDVSTSFEGHGFGLTDYRCGGRTFAHELGHNMGLHHDRYVVDDRGDPGALSYPYAFGYVNQRAFAADAPASSRWRTIMAYNRQCADAGFRCSRLLRFSNPYQTYGGDRLGVPGDQVTSSATGPSDARRTLNNTRTTVANFRASIDATCPLNPLASVAYTWRRVAGSWGSDCVSSRRPGRYARYYSFVLPRAVTVRIHLASPTDTYLNLLAGTGTGGVVIASNDDIALGSNTNSQIVSQLMRGPYTIEATTFAAARTGDFVLRVRASRPFTDDTIVAGTAIKAVHVTELRERVNDLRRWAGLPPYSWTDPNIRPGVTPVKAMHLTQLRLALNEAYDAAGLSRPRYTEVVEAGIPIKAEHINELRRAVDAADLFR